MTCQILDILGYGCNNGFFLINNYFNYVQKFPKNAMMEYTSMTSFLKKHEE